METIESFAARCLAALRGPTFLPEATLTVVVASMAAGSFPPPSGTIIASARMGDLFFSSDGYPSEQDDDGFDLGYVAAELILFEGAHEALPYLLDVLGEGRVTTLHGTVEAPIVGRVAA